MSDRSERISKLCSDKHARESYINAKVRTLVPSQIRALRLKSRTPKQTGLAKVAGTYQSRLSDLERPGESNVTLETLAWIASIHKVGLIVKFVPFSEMVRWETEFSQDSFRVTPIDEDIDFLSHGVQGVTMFPENVQSAGNPLVIKTAIRNETGEAILNIRTTDPDRQTSTQAQMTRVANG